MTTTLIIFMVVFYIFLSYLSYLFGTRLYKKTPPQSANILACLSLFIFWVLSFYFFTNSHKSLPLVVMTSVFGLLLLVWTVAFITRAINDYYTKRSVIIGIISTILLWGALIYSVI